jgi:hypothetical protein
MLTVIPSLYAAIYVLVVLSSLVYKPYSPVPCAQYRGGIGETLPIMNTFPFKILPRTKEADCMESFNSIYKMELELSRAAVSNFSSVFIEAINIV